MRAESIKTHLKPTKISGRATTLTSAFAAAIAPNHTYDYGLVAKAMHDLGQNPNDLKCVFCGKPATDWDHLFSLVKEKTFSGYGHWLGNLVPSCGSCNQKKGGQDWVNYLKSKTPSSRIYDAKRKRLEDHIGKYGGIQIPAARIEKLCGTEIRKLDKLKETIFSQMRRADKIADTVHERLQTEEYRLQKRNGRRRSS